DYIAFIRDNPQNAYVSIAEDSIYILSTKDRTLNQYLNFISQNSSNRNINKAWKRVYELETPVYDYESIKKFSEKYPRFPDRQQIDSDLVLSKKIYFPVKKDSLYGYADSATMKL